MVHKSEDHGKMWWICFLQRHQEIYRQIKGKTSAKLHACVTARKKTFFPLETDVFVGNFAQLPFLHPFPLPGFRLLGKSEQFLNIS